MQYLLSHLKVSEDPINAAPVTQPQQLRNERMHSRTRPDSMHNAQNTLNRNRFKSFFCSSSIALFLRTIDISLILSAFCSCPPHKYTAHLIAHSIQRQYALHKL